MNRFARMFEDPTYKAFIPFVMLQDPDTETCLKVIEALIDSGADALELGFAFSDPIADGPTIQRASQRALGHGATVEASFALIERVRGLSEIPIGILVYYNLIYQRGIDDFCGRAVRAGVDAVLATDLPLEESGQLEQALRRRQLGCIQLLAPNSPATRTAELIRRSTAFTYVVSVFGTTGVRDTLQISTETRIRRLRAQTPSPLVVGFGIGRADQALSLYEAGASAVIVGSALIRIIEDHYPEPSRMLEQIRRLATQFCTLEVTPDVSRDA